MFLALIPAIAGVVGLAKSAIDASKAKNEAQAAIDAMAAQAQAQAAAAQAQASTIPDWVYPVGFAVGGAWVLSKVIK